MDIGFISDVAFYVYGAVAESVSCDILTRIRVTYKVFLRTVEGRGIHETVDEV